MFHLEISGNFFNFRHPANNPDISLTLLNFHFEISGNKINDEHC